MRCITSSHDNVDLPLAPETGQASPFVVASDGSAVACVEETSSMAATALTTNTAHADVLRLQIMTPPVG
jgi:hypothetical protein